MTAYLLYCLQEHACRSEGVELARELDYKSAAAWVGHPYFDVIDNSTDFETKINRMLECVCQKLGIDTGDRLLRTSRKLKFLGKLLITKYCYSIFNNDNHQHNENYRLLYDVIYIFWSHFWIHAKCMGILFLEILMLSKFNRNSHMTKKNCL